MRLNRPFPPCSRTSAQKMEAYRQAVEKKESKSILINKRSPSPIGNDYPENDRNCGKVVAKNKKGDTFHLDVLAAAALNQTVVPHLLLGKGCSMMRISIRMLIYQLI